MSMPIGEIAFLAMMVGQTAAVIAGHRYAADPQLASADKVIAGEMRDTVHSATMVTTAQVLA